MKPPKPLMIGLSLCAMAVVVIPAAEAEDQSKGSPTKSFIHKKTKQADLEIVVHYPPGWKETDKRPAIVFFFGGGWTDGTVKQFEPQAAHLASRGMVAARADYRVKSRHGVAPKECVEDAKSAIRWMRQNAAKLGINPCQVVAAGGSAGGHIAACTALTPGLEAEGEDAKVSSKPYALVLFNPVLRFDGIPQLMQRIGDDEDLGKAISPTVHLKRNSPPTLLLYGAADRLMVQGKEFMKKSKELGHQAEMFTAEGQAHGFFNRPPWLERTTQRMDEFLVSIGCLESKAEKTSSSEWTNSFGVDKANLTNVGKNPYFIPLEPGYRLVLHGDGAVLTVTVTHKTKLLDGVQTRVVEEREEKNGKPIEISQNYFAIDKTTNAVYYFGEDVDVYRDGKVVGHPGSWLSGVNGAKFGMMMPGKPKVGDKFQQEIAPTVAMDRCEIAAIGEEIRTPAGAFKTCLRTKEGSAIEKGTSVKIYAPGVGPIKDDEFVLVKIETETKVGKKKAAAAPPQPGGEKRPAKIWNRTGPLGETPKRTTDAYPLSDQENKGKWVKFEPMTDEFEGKELDRSKWTVGMYWWKGRQPALFSDKNVTVSHGKLHLSMRKEKLPPEAEKLGYKDYTSAALHTKVRSSYGYYEVKAKPMNSAGSSSFWFQMDETPGWATEIDVFEIGGKAKGFQRKYNMNLHVFRTPTKKEHWSVGGVWEAPWRLADDYHVYGLEWDRSEIKCFVDGVLVRSVENTHWHQPLFLIFDSETMPEWFGMPDDKELPSTFSVEYVRAWKRSEIAGPGSATLPLVPSGAKTDERTEMAKTMVAEMAVGQFDKAAEPFDDEVDPADWDRIHEEHLPPRQLSSMRILVPLSFLLRGLGPLTPLRFR
jgi:acetyl esterase/lipase/beta-glucanase (GH16 family)